MEVHFLLFFIPYTAELTMHIFLLKWSRGRTPQSYALHQADFTDRIVISAHPRCGGPGDYFFRPPYINVSGMNQSSTSGGRRQLSVPHLT